MKIGVILVVETWLNKALLEELERRADALRILIFGTGRELAALAADRRVAARGTRRALHSRTYVGMMLRAMKALRADKTVDYYLCLHGDATLVESAAPLFEAIRNNPEKDRIEARRDRPPKAEDRFGRYNLGCSWVDTIGNALLGKLPGRRFQAMGLRFGHDAWGLSAKTADYILDSAKGSYFYRQCRFTVDPKNFFFHTLAFHADSLGEGASPERYASPDYLRYRRAYADHAATLCAEGPGLFYPGSPQAPVLSLKSAETAPGQDGAARTPSPYRAYPASRPPLCWRQDRRWGRLSTCAEPYFAIFFLPEKPPTALISALNGEPDFICHGDIHAQAAIAYAEPGHICPRYEPDRVALRDYNQATFIYDLVYFYRGRRFGFAADLTKHEDLNRLWTLPACRAVFFLPGNVAGALRYAVTPCGEELAGMPRLELAAAEEAPDLDAPECAALLRLMRTDRLEGPLPLLVDADRLDAPRLIGMLRASLATPGRYMV